MHCKLRCGCYRHVDLHESGLKCPGTWHVAVGNGRLPQLACCGLPWKRRRGSETRARNYSRLLLCLAALCLVTADMRMQHGLTTTARFCRLTKRQHESEVRNGAFWLRRTPFARSEISSTTSPC